MNSNLKKVKYECNECEHYCTLTLDKDYISRAPLYCTALKTPKWKKVDAKDKKSDFAEILLDKI